MATHDRQSRPVSQLVLLTSVTVVALISGLAGLAREVAQRGPRVGDIVAFNPAYPAAFGSAARLTAERPGKAPCVLDVGLIQRSGGSLVLGRRVTDPDPRFRLYWAGPRTSEGAADCGTDAVLVLPAADLGVLASAAGGFGVNAASAEPASR